MGVTIIKKARQTTADEVPNCVIDANRGRFGFRFKSLEVGCGYGYSTRAAAVAAAKARLEQHLATPRLEREEPETVTEVSDEDPGDAA